MAVESLMLKSRAARDLRDTWQGRALLASRNKPLGVVILSIIAHVFPIEQVLLLLKVTFPGFVSIAPPFLRSAGKISTAGHIVADVVLEDESTIKNAVLFTSETHFRDVLRKFADRLRLTDEERNQLFICARKWIVCDFRLDPNMNPQDPDAKRAVD